MRDAVVLRNEPAGTRLRTLHTDLVPPDYAIPGQWARVRLDGLEGMYAFASSPGEPLVLLVKEEGPMGTALYGAREGTRLVVGPALGGFPMARVAGRPLVALVGGSAISAVRPVIEGEVRQGLARPVTLLYGALTPDHRSFLADLEAWANAGVQVHSVIGAPSGTGWTGHTGFVQDVAAKLGLVRAEMGVLLAGLPVMVEAARTAYRAVGTPDEQLLVNF